jgi:peptidoglycan/LPS O-acetylase OafA/YrhL
MTAGVSTAMADSAALSRHLAGAAYRADIDGLRALAVIGVIGFHAFPSVIGGGFVGVDVFFVISGYLITGIIYENLQRGTFSFAEFYYRRIRRIFPALIVVLIGGFVIGRAILLPEEFKQLGTQIFNGAAFLSNFKFWHDTGYFDTAAETKPLLHLWSLAVEEQFYILWPLVAWAAWRLRFSLVLLASAIAVASFAVNVLYVQNHNLAAAFYSPAARFWELMLGATLAVTAGTLPVTSRVVRETASTLGFVLLALAVLLINPTSHFPGWWALLPTAGVVLIITAGPDAWFNRVILAHPVLVAIGLISYPLYLWHWPFLSFETIAEGQMPSLGFRVTAIAVSVVLAWITYWLIERPIRFGLRSPFKVSATLACMLLGVGLLGVGMRSGFPKTAAPAVIVNKGELAGIEKGNDIFFGYYMSHFQPCTPDALRTNAPQLFAAARCVQSKPSSVKDVAVIGDSHAEDLFAGLAEHFSDLNFVSYIRSVWPVRLFSPFGEVFDYVKADPHIHSVILASYWSFPDYERAAMTSLEGPLAKTVAELRAAGKTVYLIEVRPNFPFNPSACKYARQTLFWHRPERCRMDRALFEAQRQKTNAELLAVAAKFSDVHVIDGNDAFCDETACRMNGDGVLMFRDNNHLSIEGSRALAERMAPQMQFRREPPPKAPVASVSGRHGVEPLVK